MYINLCKQCQGKKTMLSKGLVTKTMLHKELISRCQVHLTDRITQIGRISITELARPSNENCFLTSTNEQTSRRSGTCIARYFTITEVPSILLSNNGKRIANSIFIAFKGMWLQ